MQHVAPVDRLAVHATTHFVGTMAATLVITERPIAAMSTPLMPITYAAGPLTASTVIPLAEYTGVLITALAVGTEGIQQKGSPFNTKDKGGATYHRLRCHKISATEPCGQATADAVGFCCPT
jgi:hypothetical protein